MKQLIIYSIVFTFLCLGACKSSEKKYPDGYQKGDEYFSTKLYFNDQWEILENNNLVFAKVTKTNGAVTDSILMNWEKATIDEMGAAFVKADISDPKFLGKYNIDVFNEGEQTTVMFQAIDEDMYTQKMILYFNTENSRVNSLYMETKEDGMLNLDKKNLLYIPEQLTQIVEFKKKTGSNSEQTIITYKLL